jgi:type IV pilus assembly protein PilO
MAMDLSKLNEVLEDFKRINPQDPGGWPVTVKLVALLGLFIAILVAGYAADWSDQLTALDNGKKEEEKQKDDFVKKKTQSVNLDAHKQQLREIDQVFGTLLKQLPNKSEMDALIIDINQAGLGRGLQFELFKPAQFESMQDFYAELPIQIRVVGSYHDIGAFASDVSRLSRIVTLNNMNILIPPGKDPSTLAMETTAKTFRYLDEDEVAKARKATKPGAAAAKK